MNAPLTAQALAAPDRDDTSGVSSQQLEAAVQHMRNAVTALRASKTSIARTRRQLPRCATDDELQLQPPKLYEVEKALVRLVRRLERRVDERRGGR